MADVRGFQGWAPSQSACKDIPRKRNQLMASKDLWTEAQSMWSGLPCSQVLQKHEVLRLLVPGAQGQTGELTQQGRGRA